MSKGLIAAGLVAVLAIAGLAAYLLDPFSNDDSDPTASRGLSGTACQRLAGLAGQLGEETDDPEEFVLELGRDGAGIRRGTRGLADLLRGGRNRILGKGFLARYDDGTQGQVRHFSGIAVAAVFATGNTTLWISRHLRHDPKGSPDDHLTEQGVDFATAVLHGDLPLDGTQAWILAHLCRKQGAEPAPQG